MQVEDAVMLFQETLQSAVGDIFPVISRRHVQASTILNFPALYISHFSDEDEWMDGGLVRKTIELQFYIYARTAKDQVPDSVLNNLVAKLNAVFTPDDDSNEFTMGQQVSWVRVQGKSSYYPGDLSDQALAIVPVSIPLTMQGADTVANSLTGKKIFGAGRFFGINNVTNPTPARFMIPQDMSVSFKRQTKSLFGENQFAEDIGSGELSCTGKVTMGATNARILADLVFGIGGTTGQVMQADNELGTLSSHAYTVTNSADTPITDLCVVNTTNGQRYTRVQAGSETAGKSYSFIAGIYTFNSAETGTTFKLSHLYTLSTQGETLTIANQPMGRVGGFTGVLVFPWTNPSNAVEQDVLTLNNCIASDTEITAKLGDYGKPTFSYEAAVDTSEMLGTFTFAEAA